MTSHTIGTPREPHAAARLEVLDRTPRGRADKHVRTTIAGLRRHDEYQTRS